MNDKDKELSELKESVFDTATKLAAAKARLSEAKIEVLRFTYTLDTEKAKQLRAGISGGNKEEREASLNGIVSEEIAAKARAEVLKAREELDVDQLEIIVKRNRAHLEILQLQIQAG